ncbi:MAG: DUF3592 domain-containing protein [Actinobacteria bacterium]|nr:DUF3592 domain-containing protein [Actinomycetota bacterium]
MRSTDRFLALPRTPATWQYALLMVTSLWRTLPRWRKALAVVLALVWLLFAFILFEVMLEESNLRKTGTEATAEVLDITRRRKSYDYADIQFPTRDGTIVQTTVDVENARKVPEAGDTVEVRYDPEYPSTGIVIAEVHRVEYSLDRIIGMPAVVGAAGLIVARAAGFKIRRRGRNTSA